MYVNTHTQTKKKQKKTKGGKEDSLVSDSSEESKCDLVLSLGDKSDFPEKYSNESEESILLEMQDAIDNQETEKCEALHSIR